MKKHIFPLLFLMLLATKVNGQDSISAPSNYDKVSFGIGFGMDYGGIGGSFLVYPHEKIGLFAGFGYAFAGPGFNAGAKFRFVSDNPYKKFFPYVFGMYGYNAAIAVENAERLNKLFYGPTFGFGLDYKSYPEKRSYWTFAFMIPVRSSEVDDYMDNLEKNHGVKFENSLLPFAFSVGYRFILQ